MLIPGPTTLKPESLPGCLVGLLLQPSTVPWTPQPNQPSFTTWSKRRSTYEEEKRRNRESMVRHIHKGSATAEKTSPCWSQKLLKRLWRAEILSCCCLLQNFVCQTSLNWELWSNKKLVLEMNHPRVNQRELRYWTNHQVHTAGCSSMYAAPKQMTTIQHQGKKQ